MQMTRAALQTFGSRAAQLVEELWGDQVVIDGQTYPAAVSRSAVGGEMVLGGHLIEALLRVRIRKANLATAPIHGQAILTFEGQDWRVDEVKDSTTDAAWSLNCVPSNRG